jgi:hypothetical protein
MEKPGMGRRYLRIRSGLLGSFVFLSIILCPVFPQETGYYPDPDYYRQYGLSPETAKPAEFLEDLEVLLDIPPDIPEIHTEWVVSLLVNYPDPSEVSVMIPQLPPFLTLDRIRTAARQNEAGKDGPGGRWTTVDLFFVSTRGGPVSLAPFEVRVPGHTGYSPPVSISIRSEETLPLRAVWEPSPPSLREGEAAEVRLRLITGKAGDRHSLSYRPEAPVNAIVEALGIEEPLPGEFLLRFRVIPLKGPVMRLNPAPLKYGDASLTVPGREFRVLPPVQRVPAGPEVQIPEEPVANIAGIRAGNSAGAADMVYSGGVPVPPFPDASGTVFPLFRKGYESAKGEAREYWDREWYAEALVVLRLNERELAAGPALAVLRRSAETALGIGFTGDERWRPRQLFLLLTAAASFMLVFTIFVVFFTRRRQKNNNVTSGSSWGYKFIVILAFVMIGTGLYGFFGGPDRGTQPGKGRTGILRGAGAFRVPEAGSVVDMVFREGEPVRIHAVADTWGYVESFEGKAGWVPLENIIPY